MTSKNSYHGFTPKSTYAEVFERTGSGWGDGIGPSKWCQCASPAEKPTKIPLSICDFDVPWSVFFQRRTLSLLRQFKNVKIHPHPSNQHPFDGKTDFPNQKSLQWWNHNSTCHLSCWLWRKVITWILRHKPRLDTAIPSIVMTLAQRLPGRFGDASSSSRLKSWCPQRAAVRMRQSSSLVPPHFAGKMKIWRLLAQWWSGKLCLNFQILVWFAKMHPMIETASLSHDALRTEQASLEVTVWTSEIDDARDRISVTDAGPPTW